LSEQDFEKILLIEKLMVTKWREEEEKKLKNQNPSMPQIPNLKRKKRSAKN